MLLEQNERIDVARRLIKVDKGNRTVLLNVKKSGVA